MDFLKLLEEYENYKRSFGIEPSPSGHSACVDFASWLNQNASQHSAHLTLCEHGASAGNCPFVSCEFHSI